MLSFVSLSFIISRETQLKLRNILVSAYTIIRKKKKKYCVWYGMVYTVWIKSCPSASTTTRRVAYRFLTGVPHWTELCVTYQTCYFNFGWLLYLSQSVFICTFQLAHISCLLSVSLPNDLQEITSYSNTYMNLASSINDKRHQRRGVRGKSVAVSIALSCNVH